MGSATGAAELEKYEMNAIAKQNEVLARQLERIKADPESSTTSREGKRAFENCVAKDDCPYAPKTHAAAIWNIGWDAAKAEFDNSDARVDEDGSAEYGRRFAPV